MDNTIRYLNTDLDLVSLDDLTVLAAIFDSRGVFPLHVGREEDGLCYARIETQDSHREPEQNIAAMVAVVESLEEPHRSVWRQCTTREFNLGYNCGADPWAFNQGLSTDLLGRIAGIDASLRITTYPDREETVQSQAEEATGDL